MIMLMDSLQIMERKTCNNPSGPLCRQVGQVGFGFVHFDDAEAAIKAAEMVKGDEHTTLDCQLSVNLRRSLDGIYQQGQAPRTHSSSRPTLPTTGLSRSHRRGPYFDRGHVQHPLSATSDTHLPPRHFHHHHNHHQRDASKSSNHTYNSTDTLPTRPHDHHTMVHMPPVMTMPPTAYHPSSMPMPPMAYPAPPMNMHGAYFYNNNNNGDHYYNNGMPSNGMQPVGMPMPPSTMYYNPHTVPVHAPHIGTAAPLYRVTYQQCVYPNNNNTVSTQQFPVVQGDQVVVSDPIYCA